MLDRQTDLKVDLATVSSFAVPCWPLRSLKALIYVAGLDGWDKILHYRGTFYLPVNIVPCVMLELIDPSNGQVDVTTSRDAAGLSRRPRQKCGFFGSFLFQGLNLVSVVLSGALIPRLLRQDRGVRTAPCKATLQVILDTWFATPLR